ncbi:MAG TPA: hypothetical protein PLK06_01465 [bacterium]|nr:hypothetical protein [bacterium]
MKTLEELGREWARTFRETIGTTRDCDDHDVTTQDYINALESEIERLKAERVKELRACWMYDVEPDDMKNAQRMFTKWFAQYEKKKKR